MGGVHSSACILGLYASMQLFLILPICTVPLFLFIPDLIGINPPIPNLFHSVLKVSDYHGIRCKRLGSSLEHFILLLSGSSTPWVDTTV